MAVFLASSALVKLVVAESGRRCSSISATVPRACRGATWRSLDAIHLAAAQALGAGLDEIVTYDRRMAEAARSVDLAVSAPT